MNTRRSAALLSAALLLCPGAAHSSARASITTNSTVAARCNLPVFGPGTSYRPRIDTEDFTASVTNRWFPLPVGRTMVYTGTKDGEPALDIVKVSPRTKLVRGVRTRVVEDRLYLSNVLTERTSDYYAQDECGNVWYFGEDTAELDARGRVVSREGSFHAGVDGAQPGVVMQAHPQLGRRFRQEWYRGHAEDIFLAALLQDMAVLALDRASRDFYAKLQQPSSHADWIAYEVEQLGRDHAGYSAMLLKSWNLPERICRDFRGAQQLRDERFLRRRNLILISHRLVRRAAAAGCRHHDGKQDNHQQAKECHFT